MTSKLMQVDSGLWQGALAHVASEGLPAEVDTVCLMATQVESIPLKEGMLFLYFPVPDDPNGLPKTTFDELLNLAKLLCNRKVLTVCHMGENRSGLMSALILVARGYSSANAVELVQERGAINSPAAPHSFWNPGFVQQVLSLECI